MFKDPFRNGDNKIVLCEAWSWKDTTYSEEVPANTNFRHHANKIFDAVKDHEPWFGIE